MMIEYINATWFSTIVLALSPSDRWAAAKNLNSNTTIPGWFIWSVGIALTVLAVSILVVTYKQRSQRGKPGTAT